MRDALMIPLVFGLVGLLPIQLAAQPVSKALQTAIVGIIEDELRTVRQVEREVSLELSSRVPNIRVSDLLNAVSEQVLVTTSSSKVRLSIESLKFRDSLASLTIERFNPGNRTSQSSATVRYLLVQRGGTWVVLRHSFASIALERK